MKYPHILNFNTHTHTHTHIPNQQEEIEVINELNVSYCCYYYK